MTLDEPVVCWATTAIVETLSGTTGRTVEKHVRNVFQKLRLAPAPPTAPETEA